MKFVYLLRHAKSDWDTPFVHDHERGLSARGKENIQFLRRFLDSKKISIDMAYISDSKRTQETFLKLNKDQEFIKSPIVLPELYEADSQTFYKLMKNTPPTVESLIFLGHNPELEEFANALLGNSNSESFFQKFPTCSLLCLGFDIEFWNELNESHKGKIVFFFTPSKGQKI
jgi:phosphohistidine phosphatase